MPQSPLIAKLHLKPGQRVLLLSAPAGFADRLRALPEGATLAAKPAGEAFDLVLLFVRDQAEVARLADSARMAVKPDGALWVAYPKKTGKIKTDLSRDSGWAPLNQAGWRVVSLFSIDDIWSALRFRPQQ